MDDEISTCRETKESIRRSVLYVNHYAGRISVFKCKVCGLEEHVSQDLDGLCRDCRPWFTPIDTNYFHDEYSSLVELKHLHYAAQPPMLELRNVDGRMRLVETENVAKRRAEANRIPCWIRYLDEDELDAWEQTLFSSRNIRPFLLPLNPEWPLELTEDVSSNCRILTDKKYLYFYYADHYWDCQTPKVQWKKAATLDAASSLEVIYQLVETLWEQGLIVREPEYHHVDGRVY